MPRVLPSVGPSSVGIGVHRLLRRRVAQPLAQVDLVEALRRHPLEVARAELLRRRVPHLVAALRREQVEHGPGERVARHQVGQVGRRPGVRRSPRAWRSPGRRRCRRRPLTWWQREHCWMNVCSPSAASVPSSGGVVRRRAGWPSTSRSPRPSGRRPPCACWRGRDRRTRCTGRRRCPARRPRRRSVWTRPGTMSCLPLSRGIQQLWITSRLVPRTSTLVSVGMTSWPLVTIGRSMPPQPVLGRVVDLPPPLLAGDVDDALGVVGLGEGDDRADGRDGDADQDQRRQDRQPDLERRLAVRLLGDRLAAVAVAERAPS